MASLRCSRDAGCRRRGKYKFSKYILAETAFSRVAREGLIGLGGGGMVTSGVSISPMVGSFSRSCSKWGCRPPPQRIVELPGCSGNPSTGVRATFSRAAVVIVEDVGVLIPFMTRSWATSGLLVVEGLRAFTTSFTALAWLFCWIIFLIGIAHRGSTGRGEDDVLPKDF